VLPVKTSGRFFQVRVQAGASRGEFRKVLPGETSGRFFQVRVQAGASR
jgi:hypothetical protein